MPPAYCQERARLCSVIWDLETHAGCRGTHDKVNGRRRSAVGERHARQHAAKHHELDNKVHRLVVGVREHVALVGLPADGVDVGGVMCAGSQVESRCAWQGPRGTGASPGVRYSLSCRELLGSIRLLTQKPWTNPSNSTCTVSHTLSFTLPVVHVAPPTSPLATHFRETTSGPSVDDLPSAEMERSPLPTRGESDRRPGSRVTRVCGAR